MTKLPRNLPETPFIGIFTINVVPSRREDFLAAMEKAMAEWAKETGIASFMLLCDRDNPNRFTSVDTFRDHAAAEAHNVAPQTPQLVKELEGCLDGPVQASFHHLMATKSDFR